ncbi:MAG: sugar phosphate isomerase/epimerase [Bauldia sp.]
MKIGLCMLLWATRVTAKHRRILADIKNTGYDGVEIPIFEGRPRDYVQLGTMLDDIGLERTAVTVIPDVKRNPVSPDRTVRQAAVDRLRWAIDCTVAVGAAQLAGPVTQPLGHFSGKGPSDAERQRCRDVHRKVGGYAGENGVTVAVEAVNRFEAYVVNTMDDLAAHVASVEHPNIKALYDTFHANIEESDPVAAYTRNAAHVVHVHIAENDRGVPGRGHVPWAATFAAIKKSGYDGWLTIEAFGRELPALAAATRAWRDFAESPEAVYRDGYRHIRSGWQAA